MYDYPLVVLTGCLLGLLVWRTQPQEAEERRRWYQRRLCARLQILTTKQHIPLSGLSYLIGRRRRKCDIPIGGGEENAPGYDPFISREHATLSFDGTNWILRPVLKRGETFRLLRSGFRPSPGLQYTKVLLGGAYDGQGAGALSFREVPPEGAVLHWGDVFQIGNTRLCLQEATAEEDAQ